MSQVKKEILKKNEKFEDGVLRADACMERYQLQPRFSIQNASRGSAGRILLAYPLSGKKEI